MKSQWVDCRSILCIRLDNMGDLIMSSPAIRALKETIGARITVLTSSMAKAVVTHIPEIDDAIIFDLPWVKTNELPNADQIERLVGILKERTFDAAVIFTVYSQNPMPAAMMAYMAGIPKILAYCRENPYNLISNWVPDQEPYSIIKHQVRRDLDLAKSIGAVPSHERLHLHVDDHLWQSIFRTLTLLGLHAGKPWLILHAGVSEPKRSYQFDKWVETGKLLLSELGYQVLLTGSSSERELTDRLQAAIGEGSFSIAGTFNIDEFLGLVNRSPVLISVNTGAVHIAAAVGTPVVVLYAQTNPQHTPWKTPCKVLQFPVADDLRSKNEVIAYVNQKLYAECIPVPEPAEIINAVKELLSSVNPPSLQFVEKPNENRGIVTN